MPSDKDIVVEAREFLSRLPDKPYNLIEHDTIFNFYLAAPDLLRALADEVERLRDCHSTKHTHTIDCALEQKRKGEWGKKDNANF